MGFRMSKPRAAVSKCQICEYSDPRYLVLSHYMRKHLGISATPYHCLQCGTRYLNKRTADSHLNANHQGESFKEVFDGTYNDVLSPPIRKLTKEELQIYENDPDRANEAMLKDLYAPARESPKNMKSKGKIPIKKLVIKKAAIKTYEPSEISESEDEDSVEMVDSQDCEEKKGTPEEAREEEQKAREETKADRKRPLEEDQEDVKEKKKPREEEVIDEATQGGKVAQGKDREENTREPSTEIRKVRPEIEIHAPTEDITGTTSNLAEAMENLAGKVEHITHYLRRMTYAMEAFVGMSTAAAANNHPDHLLEANRSEGPRERAVRSRSRSRERRSRELRRRPSPRPHRAPRSEDFGRSYRH